MASSESLQETLRRRFGPEALIEQVTRDATPTFWVKAEDLKPLLGFLKEKVEQPFRVLYDLFAIDERVAVTRLGRPASDFTVVYHLISYDRNADVRIKVALFGDTPSLPSITDLFVNANWYEREAWDLFGIRFEGTISPPSLPVLRPPRPELPSFA